MQSINKRKKSRLGIKNAWIVFLSVCMAFLPVIGVGRAAAAAPTPPGPLVASGEVMSYTILQNGQKSGPDSDHIPLTPGQTYTLLAWGTFEYNGDPLMPKGNAVDGFSILNANNLQLAETYTQPPYDSVNVLAVYTFTASSQPLRLTIFDSVYGDNIGGINYSVYLGGLFSPPTISGTVTCGQTGQNGWCVNDDQLVLSASDPQGYALTITGNAGSAPISCNGGCTVNLPKGSGTANYTVTAATSGLTASGSSTWAYDPDPPDPSIGLSGTSGSNGWYISAVNATAGGSDAISGLASAVLSVDGGSASPSAAITTDGVHTLSETAIDKAGNSASATASVKVDTVAPQVSAIGVTGTSGSNGWYISPVQLSASASDATSGVASLRIEIDGVWQSYAAPVTLADGLHTVQFQAVDNAGNVTTTAAQTYKVDTTAPVIAAVVSGTSGSNDWYTSNVQVSVSATDSTSGVSALNVSVDGGAWSAYAAPISLSDGQHALQFQSADNAGNSASRTLSVKVDTTAPAITPIVSGTNGTNDWFTSAVQLSANTTDNGSGVSSTQVSVDSGAWQAVPVTISGDGQHTAVFRAYDNAGNTASSSTSFKIDTISPAITQALDGTQGDNGWYISAATASATATDSGSGIAVIQYRVDGGAWQNGNTVTLGNGIHTVDFQASDQAGNVQSVSESAKVDTTPPQVSFSSTLSGVALSGNVALSGMALDPDSGLSSAEVSTDNGSTWQKAAAFMDGEWRLTWPTGSLPNGAYTVLLRATDNAGNKSSASDSGLILDNHPPIVGLSGWTFPGAGYVAVSQNVWPIASVEVYVNDPAGLWSDKIFLSNQSGPLTWGGRRPILFPGAYSLEARVCDAYGLCSKAESAVLVNVSPTSTPAVTPGATPTAAQKSEPLIFQRPAAPAPTKTIPTPQRQIIQPPQPTAPPAETPFAPVAVGVLTLLSAALLVSDPRPHAWRKLTLTASQGIKKQEEDKKQ
jgi:hypothetical protein